MFIQDRRLLTGNFIVFDKPVFKEKVFQVICTRSRTRWFHGRNENFTYRIYLKHLQGMKWFQINPWKEKLENLLLCMSLHPELDKIIAMRLKGKKNALSEL